MLQDPGDVLSEVGVPAVNLRVEHAAWAGKADLRVISFWSGKQRRMSGEITRELVMNGRPIVL